MRETRQGQLTIFRLNGAEWEDARCKNKCLCSANNVCTANSVRATNTDFIAYVEEDSLKESDILKACQCLQEADGIMVAVFCRGRQEELLDYAGTFELLSASVNGLIFPRELVQKAGAFHTKLREKTNFELLCRLAKETGGCMLFQSEREPDVEKRTVDTKVEMSDEEAYTCAYIIRYHLQQLHALGMMEQVYTFFCKVMQEAGMFPIFQQYMNLFMSDEKEYESIARMTAPFVVLRGDDTCMGVLQQFADDLYNELAKAGQAVIKVDNRFDEFEKLGNMVCKGIVGFQAAALEIDFFRKMHGPKFQFWFDYPLRFENILRNLPEEYWILCQDANYAALIREYYHTKNAIQFPPGGKVQECIQTKRDYDIVFIGSCFEDDAECLEGENKAFYDYMLKHPLMPFEQGVREFLRIEGQSEEETSFINKNIALKPAARMVIGYYRQAIISAILEAGFTLHVYGESWKNYRGVGKEHLIIHPQVTVEESLEELAKAKIGLNIMSWHKAGMTERVANIMLSGAVCLTEETDYLREHMKDGEEIVCFRLDRLSELQEKIARLLHNSEERERIAGNAYRKAVSEHTWKCRAEQLTALAESTNV
ncbi:MAG: glycosyltransferase family 1 protein [Lachnospiraceae bacterium]|nr:glycosyltransferase family 1 protein [Lachnospiraceae bacterium]